MISEIVEALEAQKINLGEGYILLVPEGNDVLLELLTGEFPRASIMESPLVEEGQVWAINVTRMLEIPWLEEKALLAESYPDPRPDKEPLDSHVDLD